jgi:hypothetical protein
MKPWRIPKLVWLAAILPRIWIFGLALTNRQAILPVDSDWYMFLAKRLLSVHTLAYTLSPLEYETFRLPGYPVFLMPFVALFKDPGIWVALTQCALGSATVLLTWRWLREFCDARGATLGALIMGLDWVIVMHTPMILAETLVTFLQVLAFLLTWRALEAPTVKDSALSGFVWGLSTLVKPIFLLLPAASICLWLPRKKLAALFLIVAYAFPAAWIVRNGIRANYWGLSSQGGFALLIYPAAGVQADITGKSWMDANLALQAEVAKRYPQGYRTLLEQSQAYREAALPILKNHPFRLAKFCLVGVARILGGTGSSLWFLYRPEKATLTVDYGLQSTARLLWGRLVRHPWLMLSQAIYAIGLGLIYLVSLIGAWRLWKYGHRRELIVLLFGFLYLLAVASHQGYSRFRIPLMPFLAAACAAALTRYPRSESL